MSYLDKLSTKKSLDFLRQSSINIILENQSGSGAYIASPNFPVYNYCWFRDSAFIADAMVASDHAESATRFHAWASDVINDSAVQINDLIDRKKREVLVLPEEHLHCRFMVDGAESGEDWTNFQLDGFGTWLWSLDEYSKNGYPLADTTLNAVNLLVPYLCNFWSEPSFDWWEESFGFQHISTLISIATGLERCSGWSLLSEEIRREARGVSNEIRSYILKYGLYNGRLTKWIGSTELDGSLSACISPFHFFEPGTEIASKTLKAVAEELKVFGTHRHKMDVYFGGGSWIILSAFLGLGYAESGDLDKAKKVLIWISENANENGELPEQLNTNLLFPSFEDDWIEKWGISATPLLWSHAMYLKLFVTLDNLGGLLHVET